MGVRKLHTEEEFLSFDKHQFHLLSKLAETDKELFIQASDHLPYYTTLSSRSSLAINKINHAGQKLLEMDETEIIRLGYAKIIEISDQEVLKKTHHIIKAYNRSEDKSNICECLQRLFIQGKFRWLNTFKMAIDKDQFFNMGYPLEMMGKPGVVLNDLLGDVLIDKDGWVNYESLSHREKEILQLVAKGFTTNELSEKLFLSEHTIKTHRKNIGYKLGIKNNSEWVRFAMAFEMI